MFTGIIEEIGKIKNIISNGKNMLLEIEAQKVLEGTKVGDSIAVNGVCLTVTKLSKKSFLADVMAETMRRTAFKELKKNSCVNLERAMLANGRFGGHIVSGHIDGTGIIEKVQQEGNAKWIYISTDEKILEGIVEKGSIAIDGISLTVAYLDEKQFAVSIIPHTQEETTLLMKNTKSIVNLENDVVGKYIKRFIEKKESKKEAKSNITLEFLQENGF